jgi:transcription antitermination factor NusG
MPDDFQPGDRVRVLSVTFAGMEGDVLSFEEAEKLYESVGGEPPTPKGYLGFLQIALPIFGRRVPVTLIASQIANT